MMRSKPKHPVSKALILVTAGCVLVVWTLTIWHSFQAGGITREPRTLFAPLFSFMTLGLASFTTITGLVLIGITISSARASGRYLATTGILMGVIAATSLFQQAYINGNMNAWLERRDLERAGVVELRDAAMTLIANLDSTLLPGRFGYAIHRKYLPPCLLKLAPPSAFVHLRNDKRWVALSPDGVGNAAYIILPSNSEDQPEGRKIADGVFYLSVRNKPAEDQSRWSETNPITPVSKALPLQPR